MMTARPLLAAFAGLAALAALPPADAGAVTVSSADGVTVEAMGALDLGAEEIGVDRGAFRVARVTLAPGSRTTVSGAPGEAAIVYVERGAVTGDGEALHAGQLIALEGEAAAEILNDADAVAVLVVADVVDAAR